MPDGRMVLTNEPCPGEERQAAPPQPVPRERVPGTPVTKSEPTLVEALRTLRKIQAATQVGINFSEYGKLVVEAKAAVNDALPILKEPSLKQALQGAMEAYADALTAWNLTNGNRLGGWFSLTKEDTQGFLLDAKYQFPRDFYPELFINLKNRPEKVLVEPR